MLEIGVFLGAVRGRVVFGCELFAAVRFTVCDPAATFEAVFFDAIRVLLGVAAFAGAALTRLGFLAGAGFAAAPLTAVGPFRTGAALDEILEGGLRRALATAVDLFSAFGGHHFRVLPCPTCALRRRDPCLPFRTHRPSFGRAELARIEARRLVLRTFRPPTSRGDIGREAFGNGNGCIESTQQASDLRETGDLFIDS